LEYIATHTTNFCNDILRASHHGSINGAQLDFIKKCNADYTVISTESGVHESVPHPTALQRYRDNTKKKVYRTDQDGTLTWTF
jgi:beta-lactamase superfamily II metal-dependent hydrolase